MSLLLGCQAASRAAPEQARGLLTAGAGHTCVVAKNGGVSCWGSNPDGQLGDGTVIDSAFPVATLELAGVRDVAESGDDTPSNAATLGTLIKSISSHFV